MTTEKTDEVLQVGILEPTFEAELATRYTIVRLPGRCARRVLGRAWGRRARGGDVGPWHRRRRVDGRAAQPGAIVVNMVGVDAIDLEAAKRRGIGVSNTPNVESDTVADIALGLILMALRRFGAADRYVRAGRWARDGQFPYGKDVSGLRVGILGLGRIGTAIATRLLGFGCTIAYHNRHRIDGSPYRYAESPLELASSVEVLVVAATGDRNTSPLVDRSVLEALGPRGT
jgi:lactate dehydrogenase-like 2-hydroxyacid dehydrogenase